MELIRINPDHYVIADDSDIKEGDYFLNETSAIEVGIGNYHYKTLSPECKQITHSTKPLESCCTPVGQIKRYVDCKGCDKSYLGYQKIQSISLSEVKELIGEVDMEELELKYHKKLMERREIAKNFSGQVAGNHPDMFTSREMLSMMQGFTEGYTQALEDNKDKKTRWEVEFVDGKLKFAF